MTPFPHWSEAPRILLAGLVRHGHMQQERYCHRSAWAFHIYQYHGHLRWDTGEVALHPDTWSLMPPNLSAEWSFPPEASHYVVHFTHPFSDQELQVCWGREDRESSFLLEEMEWIRRQWQSQPLAAEVALWHLLNKLSLKAPAAAARGSGALHIALSLLRNHLDQPMRIPDLARRCGVSPSHLNRLFQQEYGHSAQEELQRRRLEVATRLLSNSSLPIRVVAERVGLPDAQAFNKFIRKRCGCSPSDYRSKPPAQI